MCREVQTLPELWMERAVGRELSLEPLLRTAKEAIFNLDLKYKK